MPNSLEVGLIPEAGSSASSMSVSSLPATFVGIVGSYRRQAGTNDLGGLYLLLFQDVVCIGIKNLLIFRDAQMHHLNEILQNKKRAYNENEAMTFFIFKRTNV